MSGKDKHEGGSRHEGEEYVDRKDKMIRGAIMLCVVVFVVITIVVFIICFGIASMLPEKLQWAPFNVVIAIILIWAIYTKYKDDKIMKHASDAAASGK